jgi:carbon starvation protein CstA
MRTEMDVMRMDERQRMHWLLANRATLMFVGVVWLLMILFELLEGRTAEFLIVMVPVFAAVRFGFYFYFARDRDIKWIDRALFLALVGLGHWLATMTAWVGEFSTSGLLWFVPDHPTHGFWSATARILEFPLGTFMSDASGIPDWLGYLLMALNSLLWACGAYLLVWAARRRAVRSNRV